MKKVVSLLMIATLCLSLAACGKDPSPSQTEGEGGAGLTVVTTLFPYYDFARTVAGDRAEVTLLLSAGAESHSFEPTAQDILTIADADLFLYTGGSSEHWVEEILDSLPAAQHRVPLINCVQTLCANPEPALEEASAPAGFTVVCEDGLCTLVPTEAPAPDHGEDHEHEHEHDHEHDADEHIWTSPQNAIVLVNQICGELTALDLANADYYAANAAGLVSQLEELDAEFAAVVAEAKRDTLVFGDRFPLIYFTEAYGLKWKAAFDGCADDTEPSAARLAELTDYVTAHEIPAVYHLELSNTAICQTIAQQTGCAVLEFHSCHNVTAQQLADGVTYCQLMAQNVSALEEGLN